MKLTESLMPCKLTPFTCIRALGRLARQTNVKKGRKYTEQEWEEAEKRADAVLETLPPAYFEQGFDPVKYELEHLSMDAGPEEIEAVVERLTNSVEVGTKPSSFSLSHSSQLNLIYFRNQLGSLQGEYSQKETSC